MSMNNDINEIKQEDVVPSEQSEGVLHLNDTVEKLTPADVCARPNASRNDEHIGNKVLEAD